MPTGKIKIYYLRHPFAKAKVKPKLCTVYQRHNVVSRKVFIGQERSPHSNRNASVFVKDSPKNDKAFYLILIFYLIYDYTACASLNARATTAF